MISGYLARRRRLTIALLCTLAVLAGATVPAGAATPAYAEGAAGAGQSEAGAVEAGAAEGGSGADADASAEGGADAAGAGAEATGSGTADSGETGAEQTRGDSGIAVAEEPGSGGAALEAETRTQALDGGVSLLSMPVSGRPYLAFVIRDTAGNIVPGATVNLQGPRTGSTSNSANRWGAVFAATDCTSDPCSVNSLDQDSRPGYFAVDRKGGGSNPDQLSATSRYRIAASGTAPAGYQWTTSAGTGQANNSPNWVATIPPVGTNNQTNMNTAQSGAWVNTGSNLVHTFSAAPVLEPYAPYCIKGYAYAVTSSGQMLQVDPSGAVSATGSSAGVELNGLGISPDGTKVYALNRGSNAYEGRVYVYNTATGSWSRMSSGNVWDMTIGNGALVAGAVSPAGTYYAGGFQSPSGDFQLRSMNAAGTAMVTNGYLDLDSYDNGDIAFDGEGNMYLIRGKFTGDTRRTAVFRVEAADLVAAAGTTGAIPFTEMLSETLLTSLDSGSAINGASYDASGRLYLSSASALYMLPLPGSTTATKVTLSGTSFSNITDLASCSMPPMVKLQKLLPDGRAVAGDSFPLQIRSGGAVSGSGNTATLSGGTVLGTATATSPAGGVQQQTVGSFPVTSGQTITFAETLTSTQRSNYASGYECTVDGAPMTPAITGAATAGAFSMPTMDEGRLVLCTFKNSIVRASKSASPASGALVQPDGIVTYTLTFDNSEGLGPAALQYRDHMADVLDDAFFVNSSGNQVTTQAAIQNTFVLTNITGANAATWDAANQRINISGTVPAGQVGTLTFRVKVRANQVDATAREAADGGYLLRNHLTRSTVNTPPAGCAPSTPATCTEHPVNAWTVEKGSLPADTARLHAGGNAHYKITATKLNGSTDLRQLVLTDDLTHVFKTAGWAPDAAVPGGALGRGVYIFDANGQTIDLTGAVTPAQPTRVQDVTAPTLNSGRWTLTSGAPIDVPANGVRVEMWFAVQAGERPAGIPDGTPDPWTGADEPRTGWKFVNYATGAGKTGANADLTPNRCITGADVPDTGIAPGATQPADTSFPAQCRVQHELSANYFTIRKDAGGAGVAALADDAAWDPDPTGLWNMVGHEFEIRDSVAPGNTVSSYPSVKLCRTDYDPYTGGGWNGSWIAPAQAGDESRWDWGEHSPTLASIKAWNNANPDDQRPLCGILYPISSGGQEGRWRSENLGADSSTEPGRYWLVETRAPDRQANVDASDVREVPGVQLLSEPISFVIWPEGDGSGSGPSMQGRAQLDVSDGAGGYLDRCNPGEQNPDGSFVPGGTIAERPTACVNPTGYLMLVKDPAPLSLPLTGGQWLAALRGGGLLVLVAALAGALWWSRRGSRTIPTSRGGAG